MGQQITRPLLASLAALTFLVGCGESTSDVTTEKSPSASTAPAAKSDVTSQKSNPVATYKTAPAGQGDALK